ncbi:hypothetical protein LGV61_03725 [Desulfurispirillum indicum]|uniref:hypothetical protein n=1 Tax=Desulfurispirillum indicum TaxID=936456 RepID=UPI001CFC254C|nr:hypothetical protein [Desulfurispirillum indicum]UCZ57400.1 hypothetical protein LGV61_03725 [Desulfurispirillum indicum]
MSLNIGPINHMQILAKINVAERLHDQMENRQRFVIEKIIAEKVQENEKERMQTVKELEEAEKAGPGDRDAREKDERNPRQKNKGQNQPDSGTISEKNRGRDGHIDFLA